MVQRNLKKGFYLRLIFAIFLCVLIVASLALHFAFPIKNSSSINRYTQEYNLAPELIYGIIWTESKFNASAVSSAGAVGLMQLMPSTAEFCAEKLNESYSPSRLLEADYNIKLGTFYLAYLIDKFGEQNAICAYNAGEGNVAKWLENDQQIQFQETKTYQKRVNLAKKIYKLKLKV